MKNFYKNSFSTGVSLTPQRENHSMGDCKSRPYILLLLCFFAFLLLSGCKKTDTEEKINETKLSPPEWIRGTWEKGESQNFTFTSEDVFMNGVSLKNHGGKGSGDAVLKETQKTNSLYELVYEYFVGSDIETILYSFKIGDGTFIEAGIAQNNAPLNYENYGYVEEDPAFSSFSFTGIQGVAEINIKTRTVTATATVTTDLSNIKPTFKLTPEGTTATVNGVKQTSGTSSQNFIFPVKYTLKDPKGKTAEWTVFIIKQGGDDEPWGRPLKSGTVMYEEVYENYKIIHYFCWDDYGDLQRKDEFHVDNQEDDPNYPRCYNKSFPCNCEFLNKKANQMCKWEFTWRWKDPEHPEAGWDLLDGEEYWSDVFFDWGSIIEEGYPGRYSGGYEPWYWPAFIELDVAVSYGLMTKTTENIAGQKCDVYKSTINNEKIAIWAKTIWMPYNNTNPEGYIMVVKSAHLGCPAGAFTKNVHVW